MKKVFKLVISLLIPQLAGAIGSIFTVSSVRDWYQTLEKPMLNPPSWVFGPVWTALFLLMGYSLYMVWVNGQGSKKIAYWIFGTQLTFNIFWSILFFGLQSPALALVEIILLWLMIILNIFVFFNIHRPAAWFLVPYWLWVSFAAYLNFSIWQIN